MCTLCDLTMPSHSEKRDMLYKTTEGIGVSVRILLVKLTDVISVLL